MLTKRFDMKDLGVVDVILEIKISKTSDGFVLSQSHYIKEILDKFSTSDNSIVKTTTNLSVHLSRNEGEGIHQLKYSIIIGS